MVESLNAGIDAKGASIDDYRHVDGAQGSFQDRFLVHLRKGEPCVRCGTPIQKMRAAGRGTYICPRCQRRRARTTALRGTAKRGWALMPPWGQKSTNPTGGRP